MNWLKTHPAAVYAIVITAFSTFNSEALTNHLVSGKTLSWLDLIFAVLTAGGGVIVHSSVTPLADPKLNAQTPLVPASKTLPPAPSVTNVVTTPAHAAPAAPVTPTTVPPVK